MKSSSEILEELLKHLKISANKLSSEIGLTANTSIYHVKNGRNRISPELAGKIHYTYPEISYDWLLTGTGNMIVDSENSSVLLDKATEIKFETISDDELSLYFLKNKDRLLKNEVIQFLIEKEATLKAKEILKEQIRELANQDPKDN